MHSCAIKNVTNIKKINIIIKNAIGITMKIDKHLPPKMSGMSSP